MSNETRQRIIEATVRVLARDGYAAASVKDIANEAGVAPGLVHYYFKTKEELVAAAVAEGCQPAPWPAAENAIEAAREALRTIEEPSDDELQFQALFREMLGTATRNEEVREALVLSIRAEREKIEAAARAVMAQRGESSLHKAPAVAAVVWAATFGINVQRALDPEFDVSAAVDALIGMALR
jgi:AcrR family transcriptional regulator